MKMGDAQSRAAMEVMKKSGSGMGGAGGGKKRIPAKRLVKPRGGKRRAMKVRSHR